LLDRLPREKEWVTWCLTALWVIVIFVMIPLARKVQMVVSGQWGRQAFLYIAVIAILSVGAASVVYLLRRRVQRPGNYAWLAGVSAVFIGYTFELRNIPEEALHFVQYGILGVLLYRALSHRVRDGGIYVIAAAIGASVGIIDEMIQWITPGRFWGLRDIWLNFFAVSLTQVAIAKGLHPSIISGRPGLGSLQWLCRAVAVAVLLLGVSLHNTPSRIAWYSERISALAFLKNNPSVMVEYGYLYTDPMIGRFRSRFPLDVLEQTDATRGLEASQILDRFRNHSTYGQFLKENNPITEPFLHEARVHLYRRDWHLQKVEALQPDDESYRLLLTVALRENQILERYFPNTLRQSGYVLLPDQIAFLKQNQLLDHAYTSPVGQNLITRFTETQIGIASVLILTFLGVADLYFLYLVRKRRANSPLRACL
jgi:hypothetical protein